MFGRVGNDTQEVGTEPPVVVGQSLLDATGVIVEQLTCEGLMRTQPRLPVYTVMMVSKVLPLSDTKADPGALPEMNLVGSTGHQRRTQGGTGVAGGGGGGVRW